MQNEAMVGKLDDETVRLLMESISYLATIIENNNVDVDFNDLPHCQKLKLCQVGQLKSLMRLL
jgi:hypothetical protein